MIEIYNVAVCGYNSRQHMWQESYSYIQTLVMVKIETYAKDSSPVSLRRSP
jgi:hypothetical protein